MSIVASGSDQATVLDTKHNNEKKNDKTFKFLKEVL